MKAYGEKVGKLFLKEHNIRSQRGSDLFEFRSTSMGFFGVYRGLEMGSRSRGEV